LWRFYSGETSLSGKLEFLLLPLIPRGNTFREYCDRVMADFAARLREFSLLRLKIAPKLLFTYE